MKMNTTDKNSIFDALYSFKLVEVLEQSQNVLKSRFENDAGEERVVTQTEDGINIRWKYRRTEMEARWIQSERHGD